MRTHQPPVSCICLTYARPDLLEEAICSFLQQDYAGPKELIVLNDYAEQILAFEHPEVRVINLPRRLRTVGEKRNLAVALAAHDLLFVWDDDDIYLPHRLALSVAHINPAHGVFRPDEAWFWNQGALRGPVQNRFHGGCCYTRPLFDAVRGYPAEGAGHDAGLFTRMAQYVPGSLGTSPLQPDEIYYIYRYHGSAAHQLSCVGPRTTGGNIGHHEVAAVVQRRAAEGTLPHGRIQLQPCWRSDYQQLVASAIATLTGAPAPACEEHSSSAGGTADERGGTGPV